MKDKSYSLSCIQFFATPWTVALQASLSGKDAGVGNHSLPQEIFLTQGSNPGLLYCRQFLYQLSQQGAGIGFLNLLFTLTYCFVSLAQ